MYIDIILIEDSDDKEFIGLPEMDKLFSCFISLSLAIQSIYMFLLSISNFGTQVSSLLLKYSIDFRLNFITKPISLLVFCFSGCCLNLIIILTSCPQSPVDIIQLLTALYPSAIFDKSFLTMKALFLCIYMFSFRRLFHISEQ